MSNSACLNGGLTLFLTTLTRVRDADRVDAVLERLDPAHVQPDRRVELQRPATGRRLGAVVHHHAVDEVVVRALDLDVEPVHRRRRRLDVDVEHVAPGRARLRLDELGRDGELAAGRRAAACTPSTGARTARSARASVSSRPWSKVRTALAGAPRGRQPRLQTESVAQVLLQPAPRLPSLMRLDADLDAARASGGAAPGRPLERTVKQPSSMYQTASASGVSALRYSQDRCFLPSPRVDRVAQLGQLRQRGEVDWTRRRRGGCCVVCWMLPKRDAFQSR